MLKKQLKSKFIFTIHDLFCHILVPIRAEINTSTWQVQAVLVKTLVITL